MARCNFKLPDGVERCGSTVSCGGCKWYERDAPDAMEKTVTSANKPSAKCYSVSCPAIWFNKCTSSKYGQCAVRESE